MHVSKFSNSIQRMQKMYDVVIFGATGFTGQYVAEEAFRQQQKESLKIAVAGRSKDKIQRVLKNSADYLNEPGITNLPIIIADVANEESIINMVKQAKVILNCVGPYRHYGEQVVKACVENGTHHFDISGEPQYMESMQLKYNKKAEENGCYVVSACGFDSIPSEMGVKFMIDQFQGNLNEVEAFVNIRAHKEMRINTGTWESAIYAIGHGYEMSEIRKQLMSRKLPKPRYAPNQRGTISYCDELSTWCLPFLGPDKSVAQRSLTYLHYENSLPPISFEAYKPSGGLFMSVLTIVWGMMFGTLCKFQFGRYLMIKYPSIFSCGKVSSKGASREAIEQTFIDLLFIGRGWQSKLTDQIQEKPNRVVKAKLVGPEPGYASCSIFLVQAAITVLREADKMPSKGGVYPPLAAFSETTYLNRMQTGGVQFKVISDEVL